MTPAMQSELEAWAKAYASRSRLEQGLSPTITDPVALARGLTLLRIDESADQGRAA